ncbi:MAG TPA: hypothetical protein VEZ90_16030 [Blastocatellia bacterium]|nr:hypothetical protein [Blastocatellia bacterium]
MSRLIQAYEVEAGYPAAERAGIPKFRRVSEMANNSASLSNRLMIQGYNGKRIPAFDRTLGLDLVGLASYTDSRRPNSNRKFAPILGEGIAVTSMGLVDQLVLGTAYGIAGTVSFRVRETAYTDSVSMRNPVSGDVYAGFRGNDREFVTTLASSSNGAAPGQGKTELSIFPSLLGWACDLLIGGQDDGKPLLTVWLRWINHLRGMGELPLTGNSIAGRNVKNGNNPSMAGTLKTVALELADEAYDLIKWGKSTVGLTAGQLVAQDCSVRQMPLRAPIGWRQNIEDAMKMLLNADDLEAFLTDRVFPRSTARTQAAQAQQSAQQAVNQRRQKRKAAVASAAAEADPDPTPVKSGPAAVVSPRYVPEVTGPQFQLYPWAKQVYRASRVCMPQGGCYGSLMVGPAGTLKTTSVFEIGDGMPTVKFSVASQADVALLLGDYGRDAAGQWTPRLGTFARVVRASMLQAFCVAVKRGGRIEQTAARYSGYPVVTILEKLVQSPDDADARNELDGAVFPYYPESWRVFESAYFESGANGVGPVIRLFLDEIHDTADNRSIETVLKVALEDARQLILSMAGAGWVDLVAPNIHFVAAGNPDEAVRRGSEFGRALRSRFGFTVGVGYPSPIIEAELAVNATRKGGGPMFQRQPADISLPALSFEPPPWQAKELSSGAALAIQEFSAHTREERQNGLIPECLDVRGTVQIARTTAYLMTLIPPRQAFQQAVEAVLCRLVQLDEDGLPCESDVERLRQKADLIASRL